MMTRLRGLTLGPRVRHTWPMELRPAPCTDTDTTAYPSIPSTALASYPRNQPIREITQAIFGTITVACTLLPERCWMAQTEVSLERSRLTGRSHQIRAWVEHLF